MTLSVEKVTVEREEVKAKYGNSPSEFTEIPTAYKRISRTPNSFALATPAAQSLMADNVGNAVNASIVQAAISILLSILLTEPNISSTNFWTNSSTNCIEFRVTTSELKRSDRSGITPYHLLYVTTRKYEKRNFFAIIRQLRKPMTFNEIVWIHLLQILYKLKNNDNEISEKMMSAELDSAE
uniref:Uncharacterized protein n=1 Tax=Vespula pensylvanica TaxID=30213 RepID=A0A834N8J1_VESPE|nr:hypothetical protein H0235_016321 [Vespula pensylvanica]